MVAIAVSMTLVGEYGSSSPFDHAYNVGLHTIQANALSAKTRSALNAVVWKT